MSAQLSKLHVRFIQTQNNFSLIEEKLSLPIANLYIKNNTEFYLLNPKDSLDISEETTLLFKEKTHALDQLECSVTVKTIDPNSEEFDDALLFFNANANPSTKIFLLHITKLIEK